MMMVREEKFTVTYHQCTTPVLFPQRHLGYHARELWRHPVNNYIIADFGSVYKASNKLLAFCINSSASSTLTPDNFIESVLVVHDEASES